MKFLLTICLCIGLFSGLYAETASEAVKPVSAQSSIVEPTIILDAGHGGVDEGAKVRNFKEKRVCLATVLLVKKNLEERGYRVILTRWKDSYVSLPKRVAIANRSQAAIFVSIHFNASSNHEAKGIEIYYYDSKEKSRAWSSKRLASCILPAIIDNTSASSRGVRRGNFHVIRETQMPAVLIEGGFVTNPNERELLRSKSYLELIAKGIAEGIEKYLKS